jgi:hypothetical protein
MLRFAAAFLELQSTISAGGIQLEISNGPLQIVVNRLLTGVWVFTPNR